MKTSTLILIGAGIAGLAFLALSQKKVVTSVASKLPAGPSEALKSLISDAESVAELLEKAASLNLEKLDDAQKKLIAQAYQHALSLQENPTLPDDLRARLRKAAPVPA